MELGTLEPVEDVKVTWWDGWFTFKTDRTDANGCWRIRGHSEKGKAYMWVTFRNSKATLRGFVGNTVKLWRLLMPVEDYRGELGGGSYNNVQVTYPLWNNRGGSAHRGWSASTVINAIHHFHREAQADGVNTPPMGLDVFLASKSTTGAALMTSQIPHSLQNDWVVDGLWGVNMLPYVISDMSVLSIVPDVVIGCEFRNSDVLYALTQHEIAHTSHFTNVGSEYWGLLILEEINAELFTGSPWGDENVSGAGRIAICESWAEHLEHVYTDRRYGGNFSGARSWIDRLDRWRNHRPNHVPVGLHLDLIDNVEPMTSRDRFGGGTGAVIDNVTGLTNGQLFSVLDAATDAPQVYRKRIINGLLPGSGIAVVDIDALFNSY